MSIADLPVDERPRERLMRGGAIALSDAELVALLIEPGRRGKSSLDIARELVADGLLSLARKEWIPGRAVGSLGPGRVARIAAALELGRRVSALSTTGKEPARDPEAIAQRLIARYGQAVQETLGAIYLDVRGRIIREREVFVGSLRTAAVSPRDLFRLALEDHAASMIIFHNHPSGDPSPSPDDLQFTRKVLEAAAVMDIGVLDHIIVGTSGYVSMKQRGLM